MAFARRSNSVLLLGDQLSLQYTNRILYYSQVSIIVSSPYSDRSKVPSLCSFEPFYPPNSISISYFLISKIQKTSKRLDFNEAKETLIESWGTLGSNWGINKAMAKIHILLLISPKPLSTEDIMEQLNISRGNANINIRALIDWGLVHKKLVPGERKEFFYPIKDMWELVRIVAAERRKREIAPVTKTLKTFENMPTEGDEEKEEFKKTVQGMIELIEAGDLALNLLHKLEKNKFLKTLLIGK